MIDKDRFLNDIFQYRRAVIILSAVRSGLFEVFMEKKEIDVPHVARIMKWNERGTEILLNALCSLGYLKKNQEKYLVDPVFQKVLIDGNYKLMGEWMMHEWRLISRWIHLGEVLESGKPYREPEKKTVHLNHRNFILSMAHREKENLITIVNAIDLSGYKKLLDLGGGPGLFAIGFVEKYSALRVTIFDTPETEPIALEFMSNSSAKSRIEFKGGDFMRDDFGHDYDVALLSSILHIYGPEDNKKLLSRIYHSLNEGGKVIIRDFFLNNKKTGPVIGTLFAVNMLINTENGNAYSFQEIREWLTIAGFTHIQKRKLEGRMELLVAEK
jgi:SAM-dependent methyltransferase